MIIGGDDLKQLAARMKFPQHLVGPSSVDLRLGSRIIHIPSSGKRHVYDVEPGEKFTFVPDGFYLGASVEYIELPNDVAAMIRTRSSSGRVGVKHFSSDFIDQGFRGHVTFEFEVTRPVSFGVGTVPVFQLVFYRASSHAHYSGRYQDQGPYPVPSRDDEFVVEGLGGES